MTMALYFAFGSTLFCGAMLSITFLFADGSRATRRAREVMQGASLSNRAPLSERRKPSFQQVVHGIRMKVGLADDRKLRERFLRSGRRGNECVEVYFAVRLLGPILGVAIGSFIPSNTFFWALALAAAAYLAPDFWLERAIKTRRAKIERSIPDAVDLLVICVEAGLGLDQAMLRVAHELSISHPEIHEEFLQINREQRAGKPRMAAWQSMADRTQIADVAAFSSMLVQTEKYGTPIARALSMFADGIRQKRRQRAEEMAAKTTVKIIVPLVLFIFPSMFIVLLAPAVLSIARGLAVLSR